MGSGEKKKTRKSKYSKEQVAFVKDLVIGGENVTRATKLMCEEFKIKYDESIGRTFRKKMEKEGLSKVKVTLDNSPMFLEAKKKKFDKNKQRFIITWAQSYSELNIEFWKNILAYADKIDAAVHVIAGRYKNPTSLQANSDIKANEKDKTPWAEELEQYLDANRQRIHKFLTICGDVKVQPTATNPLSGFNGLTGNESCIIGHPRVHMDGCPVLAGQRNKTLFTTGAVTHPDYTDTKSGKKGEFHHQYGFVIVELDGDDTHIRQVQADIDGTFYDLKYKVEYGNVKISEIPLAGMVFGDIHIGDHDQKALDVSFKMVDLLGANQIVIHDIFNGHSISHHEINDPFIQLQRELDGTNSLKWEIKQVNKFFKKYEKYNFVVVRSNHDDFLDRWLRTADWKKVPNRYDYLKYAKIIADGKANKGVLPYILEKKNKNVLALSARDSFLLGGIECGMHGHEGSNGSRGSYTQFRNLNFKNVTGHTHSPRRYDGHLSVGTLTFRRLHYTNGQSTWDQANVAIYPNGKTSHIFISKNYKFTTLF